MAPTLVDRGTLVTEPTGQLAELYVRFVPAANRLAFLLTGDRALAEDLVHDAFVRCVGRFGHLRAHAEGCHEVVTEGPARIAA